MSVFSVAVPRAILGAALIAVGSVYVHDVRASSVTQLTELPIEELLTLEVYSASRFNQKRSEAPSAVTVVTADDIKTFGWRTLAELLASVRGLYISGDRNYSYLGARGFLRPGDYNTRFLLLVDGNRINDSIFDQASIGTEFILDMDLIERVEYVHGPGSSIYGANALFGVINVITKNGRDLQGPRAAVETGSEGARRLQASYGLRAEGGADLLLGLSAYRQSGSDLYYPEFDTSATNNGVAVGLDHDRADRVFLKAGLAPFSLTLVHSRRTKGIPTASYSQLFNDPRSHTVDAQTLIDLGYRRLLAPDAEFVSRVFWGAYDYDGDYVYDVPPVTVNRDQARARWWGSEARLTRTIEGHKLVFGAEYQRDARRDQMNYDVAPYQLYLDSRRSAYRWGVYLQDEVSLRDDLLLNAGLRYDRTTSGGGTFNPRLGLIYKATPATTIKAVYATAFRGPNAYELYYDLRSAGGQKSNPALGPERLRSAELILEHHLAAATRISATLFQTTVSDLISQTLDPADQLMIFQNLDRVRTRGVGAEIEHAWRGGARVRASLTLQRAEDGSSGMRLVNSPSSLAKVNWSIPVFEGRWRTGIEGRYVGSRRTLAAQTGGYWLANLSLSSIRLAPGLEASATLYNLFDRRYSDPGSAEHAQDAISQDGRSFRIRLAYSF